MIFHALCHTCKHQHAIDFDPRVGPGSAFSDWTVKHAGHDIDFRWPGRTAKTDPVFASQWAHYLHNADVKVAYAASADYTITLASLASSSTFVAGQESTWISNASNKYLDYLISGKITTGTSPTANTFIRVYVLGSLKDTPTYPDVFDGTDSAETVTNTNILAAMPLGFEGPVASTSNIGYPVHPFSCAMLFGGAVPNSHGLFVTHNTGVALNSTGGNHVLSYTPIYATVT